MIKIKFKNRNKIVALDGNKEVGYLNFSYAGDASKKRNLEICFMWVDKEYRKNGIGTNMINYLIKNNLNVTWISLWTGKEIEKLNKTDFYIRNGFKKLAYQEDYYAPGIGTTLFGKRIYKDT